MGVRIRVEGETHPKTFFLEVDKPSELESIVDVMESWEYIYSNIYHELKRPNFDFGPHTSVLQDEEVGEISDILDAAGYYDAAEVVDKQRDEWFDSLSELN